MNGHKNDPQAPEPKPVISQTDEDKKKNLLEDIKKRRALNEKWARRNITYAESIAGIVILASLLTTVASAFSTFPSWLIAVCAAVPGAAVLIDKSFAFAVRGKLYHQMRAKLHTLANSLEYEGVSVEETSKALSKLGEEMTKNFPGVSIPSLTLDQKDL